MQILVRHPDGTLTTHADPEALPAVAEASDTLCWVHLEGEPAARLELLARRFGLHPITAEDLVNKGQRIKLEEFDSYAFLVLYALRGIQGDALDAEEVHIVLTRSALLTSHSLPLESLRRVFTRCQTDPRLLHHGPGFLLYLVSDAIVDACFPVLEGVEREIDTLEDAVITAPGRSRMHRIFELKRLLVELRKLVGPQRELLNTLSRRDFPYIDPRTAVYFRDVHDHLVRASEMIDACRDLAINVMEAYLAASSNRLGQVMKQLTIIATIFMPLSFLTGFFGMNFTGIPFQSPWLLAGSLAAMLGVPAGMLLFFLRQGWLTDGRRITSLGRLRAWLHRR